MNLLRILAKNILYPQISQKCHSDLFGLGIKNSIYEKQFSIICIITALAEVIKNGINALQWI
ncbi:MAG: hypothetical protein A2889_06410 [Nitrospinae bacterium RIFCSPLOWO2_01_FULL_39_10]|nr:MAG: hypothetical protein A2889_06410 [Nitrospinae bacterium RIFCSPLOWO2_01_FULL_39_10]